MERVDVAGTKKYSTVNFFRVRTVVISLYNLTQKPVQPCQLDPMTTWPID